MHQQDSIRVRQVPRQRAQVGVRQRLREETRLQHAALEQLLPISRPGAGFADYLEHLQFLLGFHEPMEQKLERVPDLRKILPDLSMRWKTPLLQDDLGSWDTEPRACSTRLPDPQDATEALGVIYVLEGATLGARTLLPQLRANGVIPGEVGSTYIQAYGDATPVMWSRICTVLGQVPARRVDDVVAAATHTFSSLIGWRAGWKDQP